MVNIENSAIFTVATKKYLSLAILSLKSVEKFNNLKYKFIFIVDCNEIEIKEINLSLESQNLNSIKTFCSCDLIGSNKDTFQNSFKYYNNIEVCCLAKYIGFVHLKTKYSTLNFCIFVDSDVFFYGSLTDVMLKFKDYAIYLTPHTIGPINDEDEHMYLMHGWVNAGFILINFRHKHVDEILSWLVNRISRRGYFAPEYGLSCDQTWLSLVPMIFPDYTEISHNDGLNVAYWNLNQRKLRVIDNVFYSNSTQLVFVHFSGYDSKIYPLISKHSNLTIEKDSTLSLLCTIYDKEERVTVNFSDRNDIVFSTEKLLSRMQIGFNFLGITNKFSTEMPGLFGLFGRKVDSFLKKIRK